jgi:hypothetical protein
MADRDDQDKELPVLNLAQNAVIADAVAPYPDEIAAKGLAKPAGVAGASQPSIKIAEDLLLDLTIQS